MERRKLDGFAKSRHSLAEAGSGDGQVTKSNPKKRLGQGTWVNGRGVNPPAAAVPGGHGAALNDWAGCARA